MTPIQVTILLLLAAAEGWFVLEFLDTNAGKPIRFFPLFLHILAVAVLLGFFCGFCYEWNKARMIIDTLGKYVQYATIPN